MADNFNPDDPTLKGKAVHISGSAGGVLVGQRHSEGGIKAINKSTGQPLEMEGGEVVITRDAVSDQTKRSFNGEMLTNRQILSKINESGGGIQFAEDGAELPTEICCTGNEYEFGGETMSDFDIMNSIYSSGGITIKSLEDQGYDVNDIVDFEHTYDQVERIRTPKGILVKLYENGKLVDQYLFEDSVYKKKTHSMKSGGSILQMIPLEKEAEKLAEDLESEGSTLVIGKMLQEKGLDFEIKVGEISEIVEGKVVDSFFPHFWIETKIEGRPAIIDLKSRLWMDESAPQGVIDPDQVPNWKYDGMTKRIPQRQLDEFYKTQLAQS